jgi:hypothetical protein
MTKDLRSVSDEAYHDIRNAAERALAAPNEKVISLGLYVLVEADDDPLTAHRHWLVYPHGARDELLREMHADIENILVGNEDA